MEIKITGDGCERKLPSGAVQAFPIGWNGELPDETALRFVAEGKAEVIGGEASLSADHLAFLRAFADHAMAEIAAQTAQAGDDQAGEGDADDELPPATDDDVQALEGVAGEPSGLPPEIALDEEVVAAPAPAATPAPAAKPAGKGKR
ncbi:MAG: hypothetical protein B7Y80_01505 [Hyphomicrobium sp. 32-62-53]|nr:MAG: hypothetical protein B7Z29_01855 [Hyphomicrobium sp. 12-62-95]OYY01430.1 MAG: hypothetical protein B7Y80_01505 [Hyphomicrobium sp. 32-62-53]